MVNRESSGWVGVVGQGTSVKLVSVVVDVMVVVVGRRG